MGESFPLLFLFLIWWIFHKVKYLENEAICCKEHCFHSTQSLRHQPLAGPMGTEARRWRLGIFLKCGHGTAAPRLPPVTWLTGPAPRWFLPLPHTMTPLQPSTLMTQACHCPGGPACLALFDYGPLAPRSPALCGLRGKPRDQEPGSRTLPVPGNDFPVPSLILSVPPRSTQGHSGDSDAQGRQLQGPLCSQWPDAPPLPPAHSKKSASAGQRPCSEGSTPSPECSLPNPSTPYPDTARWSRGFAKVWHLYQAPSWAAQSPRGDAEGPLSLTLLCAHVRGSPPDPQLSQVR